VGKANLFFRQRAPRSSRKDHLHTRAVSAKPDQAFSSCVEFFTWPARKRGRSDKTHPHQPDAATIARAERILAIRGGVAP
jgi:hypothetical protein